MPGAVPRWALADLVESSPCILTKYQLGENVDKDPEWRSTAIYSRDELETLISDARVPSDRHVLYALEGVAGLRLGEAEGLRWRHYDRSVKPLGALLIATSYDKGRTKTKQVRRVPVHPVLAAILDEWNVRGWEETMGRAPTGDNLVVPMPPEHVARRRIRSSEHMRTKSYAWKRLSDDLVALGFRHRRGHDLRRTMIARHRGRRAQGPPREVHPQPGQARAGHRLLRDNHLEAALRRDRQAQDQPPGRRR